MKRIVRVNKEYQARLMAAMDSVSDAIDEAIHQTIVEPEQWDEGFGITRRRNGEVVEGSYRNIKDLGNLEGSQTMARNGKVTRWEWNGLGETPAVLVYTGWTTTNGNRVPGRPFPERGIEKVDIVQTFTEGFEG